MLTPILLSILALAVIYLLMFFALIIISAYASILDEKRLNKEL